MKDKGLRERFELLIASLSDTGVIRFKHTLEPERANLWHLKNRLELLEEHLGLKFCPEISGRAHYRKLKKKEKNEKT